MNYHIITLGCPKNTVDSEGMGTILAARGHRPVAQPEDADVLIVNTCGFLAAARQEALDVLRDLGARKRPGQRLIAAGCMVESHASLVQSVAGVDATLSTRRWPRIGDLFEEPLTERGNGQHRQSCQQSQQGHGAENHTLAGADWRTASFRRAGTPPSAYLKISDGCSLRCSFCLIPTIKGAMRSKPPDDIVREAQELTAQGVQEIVLVAQHLTDYGRDLGFGKDGLATLLERLGAELPPDRWLRLMYAYPQSVTPRLIETMARLPQICHYLDMPLQHAHPDVLCRMHRPSCLDHTRQIVGDLRQAMPDIALRSTFMVGFPGETEQEFHALLDFLSEMQFDRVGVFHYSQEHGTPAATAPHQVPPRTIERRWHRAMRHQQPIALERNRRWQGHHLDVLVEGQGMTDDGRSLFVGRSFREAPEVDGQVLVWGQAEVGSRVRVRITQATAYDLWGEPVADGESLLTLPARAGVGVGAG
ncbi:MAG: 30S ribosomal protein S12 methylthiotransferase RimO [Chloroflexaceae bacterium]|nr:30S ribosomal protein S12 methylthiotransferase RimO [Chloroflexaceae bacterium]